MSDAFVTRKRLADRVAAAASIVDLRLRQISGELLTPGPKLPLSLDAQVLPAMVRLSPAAAVYHVTYRLRALSAAAGKPTAFQAEITMSAVFEFTDSDFSDGDLQTFGLFGVLDIVHPFVRELAHSLSGRMGLPPLLLEVKTPVAAE